MDPNETWRLMLDAFSRGIWEEAQQHAEDLLGWLAKKGFPPKICITDSEGRFRLALDDETLNRSVAELVASKICRACR